MNSEQLLSKQGPLAHIWLAANYEKKLSKQQLINTNIISSSKYISNQPINSSGQQNNANTITLRLSGQLLLGIVRIFSRKTKYLLDDVNDVLYKTKNSFKYASGAMVLGGIGGANGNANLTINLAPQRTIISNVSSLTLHDQVTDFELLYQEDLNLDDDVEPQTDALISSFDGANKDSFNYDQSVEYGRHEGNAHDDFDLQLDFDLNVDDNDDAVDKNDSDRSIEVGRNGSQVLQDNLEQSLLDINTATKDPMDFDLGNPLETIDELPTIEPLTPPPTAPAIQRRPRRAIVGINEEGEIRTNKRKLTVDSAADLETGIPTDLLRSIQHVQMNNTGISEQSITLNLTDSEKLLLIRELSTPEIMNKRRKLWNIDDQLRQECVRLHEQEEAQRKEIEEHDEQFDFNNDDFDLSLPGLDSDVGSPPEVTELPALPIDDTEDEFISATKASIQIAEHLRNSLTENKDTTEFSEIIEKDMSEPLPLGTISKNETSIKVDRKREATKCFFELLVLATHDCISIDQEAGIEPNDIGGKISIRSRDKLFSNFL